MAARSDSPGGKRGADSLSGARDPSVGDDDRALQLMRMLATEPLVQGNLAEALSRTPGLPYAQMTQPLQLTLTSMGAYLRGELSVVVDPMLYYTSPGGTSANPGGAFDLDQVALVPMKLAVAANLMSAQAALEALNKADYSLSRSQPSLAVLVLLNDRQQAPEIAGSLRQLFKVRRDAATGMRDLLVVRRRNASDRPALDLADCN